MLGSLLIQTEPVKWQPNNRECFPTGYQVRKLPEKYRLLLFPCVCVCACSPTPPTLGYRTCSICFRGFWYQNVGISYERWRILEQNSALQKRPLFIVGHLLRHHLIRRHCLTGGGLDAFHFISLAGPLALRTQKVIHPFLRKCEWSSRIRSVLSVQVL